MLGVGASWDAIMGIIACRRGVDTDSCFKGSCSRKLCRAGLGGAGVSTQTPLVQLFYGAAHSASCSPSLEFQLAVPEWVTMQHLSTRSSLET
jgi:hypothetical protein